MRGRDDRDEGLFSYLRIEERVPGDHPLRAIRALTETSLSVGHVEPLDGGHTLRFDERLPGGRLR